MDLKEHIQKLSGKEIVLAMVESLENPPLHIKMETFGDFLPADGMFKCFGCAATATIIRLSGRKFNDQNIETLNSRSTFLGIDKQFLNSFENAIDSLRTGNIHGYNKGAFFAGFAQLKFDGTTFVKPGYFLPRLENNYTKKELDLYKKFAEEQ